MPSEKRRSSNNDDDEDDEVEEVPRKRSRSSVIEDPKPGTIEKIVLKNFMCHSALEISFNKHVNFVVGRNGSGKSAILSALIVALGSRAATTSRASSLKEFVKRGTTTARVEVTVSNEGQLGYKPEVYGKKITVSRTLHSATSSSVVKIKSEKGEVISTKRDELQRLITTLNIQVDNPVSILNQETSRTFLSSVDPIKKYSIFMKATRLDEISQLHADALHIEKLGERKLQLCADNLSTSKKEVDELTQKYNDLVKIQNYQQLLINAQNEIFWARVRDEEIALAAVTRKFNKEEALVKRKKGAVDKFDLDFEKAMEEIRTLKKDEDGKGKEIEEVTEKMNDAGERNNVIKNKYSLKLRQYNDMQGKIVHHRNELAIVNNELEKDGNGSSGENTDQKKHIEERHNAVLSDKERLLAVLRTTTQDYDNLQGERYHYKEMYNKLRAAQADVLSVVDRRKREINTLKNQKNNLSLFGPWMPQLLQRIEEAHRAGQFARKPLGPLGIYIKVRDKEWVLGIEADITVTLLRSFCCHCEKDCNRLKEMMRTILPKNTRLPGIVVSKFKDKLHNIQNHMAKCRNYKTIFELLDISDVNVANCLIDNRSIENVLLIPNNSEASKLMSDRNRPFKNCKRCIIPSGDVYFPYPDYKTYANSSRTRSHLLQMSTQDSIRGLEEEIAMYQQEVNLLDKQQGDLHGKIESNKMEFQMVERKRKEIQDQISKLDAEIKDLAYNLENYTNSYELLNSERQELEQKLLKIWEVQNGLSKESEKLKTEYDAAEAEFQGFQAAIAKLNKEKGQIQNQVLKVKETLKMVDMQRKEGQRNLEVLENQMKETQLLYHRQKEKTEESLRRAEDIHPDRLKTNRPINKIEEEIKSCESYVSVAESNVGDQEAVTADLAAKKNAHANMIKSLNSVKNGLEMLRKSVKSRQTLYWVVRNFTSLKVVYLFDPLLKQRGYKGRLEFDHDAKTLVVKASPKIEEETRETKSLSGGERSFSTVAFLLSLWECVDAPFYFLDEFDVFMDKMNRQLVLELLLSQAKQKHQFQYVFLTPQGTSSLQGGDTDITVFKMSDPERQYNQSEQS